MGLDLTSIKNTLAGFWSQKAKFKIEGELLPLYVQFNPEQYSVQESVEYNQVSGQGTDKEVTQYVGSVKSVASLSFHFDTDSVLATSIPKSKTATDVSILTSKFANLLRVVGELHRPPYVTFTWGSINITGFIVSVSTTFTMFNNSGMPVRARVDCQMLSMGSESAIRRSPLMSPDRTKSRILTEDTSLWELANHEYGDINQWRTIARANDIMDPLDIAVGTVLKVPALTDL